MNFDLVAFLREFGFPVAVSLLAMWWFSSQLKVVSEQNRQDTKDTLDYLKTLLTENIKVKERMTATQERMSYVLEEMWHNQRAILDDYKINVPKRDKIIVNEKE